MQKRALIHTITDQDLQLIVDISNSLSDILRKLGYRNGSGDTQKILKNRMRTLNLSKYEQNIKMHNKQNYKIIKKKLTPTDVFKENSTVHYGTAKQMVIKYKIIDYICEKCKNSGIWQNEKITLHLDHKNGNNKDNRLENLRFLCPNCHSQTPTYAGRNNLKLNKKIYYCQCCRKEVMAKNTKHCRDCFNNKIYYEKIQKIIKKEELEILINKMSIEDVRKKLNVSRNQILRMCERYDIEVPKRERGYWLRNNSWEPEDKNKFLEDVKVLNPKEIIKKYKISMYILKKYCKYNKIILLKLIKERKMITEEEKQNIKTLYYEQNLSIGEIGKILNRHKGTVFNVIKQIDGHII
jgi:hypothetical protein